VQTKREKRMREIVRVAAAAFAAQGFDRTNFDDIAAELGMRGASLYHYVKSKDALFLECVQVTTTDVLQRLAGVVDPDRPAVENLRSLFREQVIIQVRDYPEFGAVFYRIAHPDPDVRRQVLELRHQHTQVFRDVAEAMVAEGDASPDRWQVALMLAAGALAHMVDWYKPAGRKSLEALADEVADDLVELVMVGNGRR
jgi:AcrR family transcriptional regulator